MDRQNDEHVIPRWLQHEFNLWNQRLTLLNATGKETMNYWNLESPRFAVREGPAWLTVDPVTGLLSGVPDRPVKVAMVVTAVIDREVRSLDTRMLRWGLEKVLSKAKQRVGVATQKFTIDVAP